MLTLGLITGIGIAMLQVKSERLNVLGQGIVVMAIVFAIALAKGHI